MTCEGTSEHQRTTSFGTVTIVYKILAPHPLQVAANSPKANGLTPRGSSTRQRNTPMFPSAPTPNLMKYSRSIERNEQKQIQALDQQNEPVAHHISCVPPHVSAPRL